MTSRQIKKKGIIAKLLEQGIRILLIKECKKISNIKINIISSSINILKGEIQKINIIAQNINYKDLLFDKVELEANHLKINFKLSTKELYFKNDPKINFKISLSQYLLNTVLLSNNWNCIGDMISKEIFDQDKSEDIRINNCKFVMKSYEEEKEINRITHIEINTDRGKLYFKNRTNNKTIQIPIEEKVYIKNVNIENNLINIFGNSPISF